MPALGATPSSCAILTTQNFGTSGAGPDGLTAEIDVGSVAGVDPQGASDGLNDLRSRLAPAGIVVSAHRDESVTLVPDRGALSDAAVLRLLRTDDVRGALNAPVARTLHRVTRGVRPHATVEERKRVSTLVRGGWVIPVAGSLTVRTTVELHPDVRFSLALDERFRCRRAGTTRHTNRLPNEDRSRRRRCRSS